MKQVNILTWMVKDRIKLMPMTVLLVVIFGMALNITFLVMWWSSAIRNWVLTVSFNAAGEAGFEGVLFHLSLILWGWVMYKLARGAARG